MGLFDSLLGGMQGSTKLTEQEAFAGILFGASACDGHIADDEIQGLITCLLRMKLYKRFDGNAYNKMLNKLHGALKKRGVEPLVDACVEALPDGLANTAFTNACDIVLSDGIVEPDEKEFIDKLQKKLRIEANVAKTIVQVMVIKNKG